MKMMNEFLAKAALIVPVAVQMRADLPDFMFGPRPDTSFLHIRNKDKPAHIIDQKYYLYYGEVDETIDAVGRQTFIPHGQGIIVFKNSNRLFEGWFNHTSHLNGRARIICQASNSVYEGEYLDDQIHGKGHQRWLNDGSEYIGDYV